MKMATPREILKRAAGKATGERLEKTPENLPDRNEPTPRRMLAPQPIRENSVYRRLMCSHDRVHTRHIPG